MKIEHLAVVLELAEQAALTEDHITDDPDLKMQREEQRVAIDAVRHYTLQAALANM